MIEFKKYILPNKLTLITHQDQSSPMAFVNILYKVGARNEDAEHTGFAHLFEHLMFGGSEHAPNFDEPVQLAGGESNAFTTNDYTNYYITLPKDNIETALWLESDRMMNPNFTQEGLDIQKSVVIEEFNQRYLNQPYGDVWMLLNPIAYQIHPYQWPTIGKNIKHIEQATLEEVKAFFYAHYLPENAIISIVADMEGDEIFALVEKWFADIPNRNYIPTNIPVEPEQTEARILDVKRNVPADMIYKVYHNCTRISSDYQVCDILTDILSSGKSARLYRNLVQNNPLFSQITAYITGDLDAGLLVIAGSLLPGITMEQAEEEIEKELKLICNEFPSQFEMEKSINKIEMMQNFAEMQGLNKAMNLGYYEFIGQIDLINEELNLYTKITAKNVSEVAAKYLQASNCSTLYYRANKD